MSHESLTSNNAVNFRNILAQFFSVSVSFDRVYTENRDLEISHETFLTH